MLRDAENEKAKRRGNRARENNDVIYARRVLEMEGAARGKDNGPQETNAAHGTEETRSA